MVENDWIYMIHCSHCHKLCDIIPVFAGMANAVSFHNHKTNTIQSNAWQKILIGQYHSHIIRRFIGEPRIGSCEPVRSSSAYWVAGIRTKIRSHKRTRSIGRKSGKIDGRDSF